MAPMGQKQNKKIEQKAANLSYKIAIKGIVQGVGFRPFVYNLAKKYNLTGYVNNSASGVSIEVEGPEHAIQHFIKAIKSDKPPASSISSLQVQHRNPLATNNFSTFSILDSSPKGARTALAPPDMDICKDCLKEVTDPKDRRHLYPFINCTNCGPRYTILEDLPYDRPLTSMKSFPLCHNCEEEYNDPGNRRFHAQPNACPVCGPQLFLYDSKGHKITKDPLTQTRQLLSKGNIIAIKGIGGFHLAVDAYNQKAVSRLRALKRRKDKPLAIMANKLATIRSFASTTPHEEQLISSTEKPIVLLRKDKNYSLPVSVAPKTKFIGAMLPYSPLHHLLFLDAEFSVLVMTSGNISDEPIIIDFPEAQKKLGQIADYFLTHNRPILTSNDDSLVKSEENETIYIRRSRSYAPLPIQLSFDSGFTLALGGTMKNTVCLTKRTDYFLSQHNGDLQHFESIRHFESVVSHLKHILRITPDLLVHDLHPDYHSSAYAKNTDIPSIAVQHHHAHAVACMAENNLNEPVIAITLDGSGYGTDGTIWGGEILIAEHATFSRAAHLKQFLLPGGDKAAREPWRIAASCLYQAFGDELTSLNLPALSKNKEKLPTLLSMLKKKFNTPVTSSCGRLFDCVASITGLRHISTYEGQAATELEMAITEASKKCYSFTIEQNGDSPLILSWEQMLREIETDMGAHISISTISSKFHNTIVEMYSSACKTIRKQTGINKVVLSGGVFQNSTISIGMRHKLTKQNFQIFSHHQIPPNDGGLCLGQAVAGRAKQKLSIREKQ